MNIYFTRISFLFFLVVILFSSISILASLVGPYEVIIYEARDYVGHQKSYKLNPSKHRLLAINYVGDDINDKISSIHVGSKVRVICFAHHDFHAPYKFTYTRFPPLIGFKVGSQARGPSHIGYYDHSTSVVDHNDLYSSLIIIPKDFGGAWGVAFFNPRDKFVRFEPLPNGKS